MGIRLIHCEVGYALPLPPSPGGGRRYQAPPHVLDKSWSIEADCQRGEPDSTLVDRGVRAALRCPTPPNGAVINAKHRQEDCSIFRALLRPAFLVRLFLVLSCAW